MPVEIGVDSYGDEAGLLAYATARGVDISGDETQLLIKGMDYIETKVFFGSKYDTDQDLSFPRTITLTDDDFGEVPKNVIKALYVSSLLIDSGEELNPTVSPSIKKEKVDVVEVTYQDNASSTNYYPQVDMLLAPYMDSIGSSFKVSR